MMNSASSTKSGKKRQARAAPPPAAAEAVEVRPDGGFQPVHLLIMVVVGAASVGALVAHGNGPANIIFVVLTVIASGIGAMAVYRTFWPLTADMGASEPDMVGGRTRAALEREKGIVLRAIKELEFDRAMGKVSEADCVEMIGRLRGRAVRLIRQLDAGSAGYRELIERELNARLASADSRR